MYSLFFAFGYGKGSGYDMVVSKSSPFPMNVINSCYPCKPTAFIFLVVVFLVFSRIRLLFFVVSDISHSNIRFLLKPPTTTIHTSTQIAQTLIFFTQNMWQRWIREWVTLNILLYVWNVIHFFSIFAFRTLLSQNFKCVLKINISFCLHRRMKKMLYNDWRAKQRKKSRETISHCIHTLFSAKNECPRDFCVWNPGTKTHRKKFYINIFLCCSFSPNFRYFFYVVMEIVQNHTFVVYFWNCGQDAEKYFIVFLQKKYFFRFFFG